MNDKHFRNFALAIGSAALLYWLYKRKQSAHSMTQEAPEPVAANDPMNAVYSNNPGAFNPPSLGTINIDNQGLSYLSNQYMPLFGFVGMAQGVTFQ